MDQRPGANNYIHVNCHVITPSYASYVRKCRINPTPVDKAAVLSRAMLLKAHVLVVCKYSVIP